MHITPPKICTDLMRCIIIKVILVHELEVLDGAAAVTELVSPASCKRCRYRLGCTVTVYIGIGYRLRVREYRSFASIESGYSTRERGLIHGLLVGCSPLSLVVLYC
jgi:hypothetical protein